MSGAGRVLVATVVAASLLAVACDREPADPEARLTRAIEATFSDSFAYRVSAEADREALGSIGEGAGQAAAFLNTFAVSGVIAGELTTFDVQILVSDPVLEVRRFGDEELYVRLGLLDLPIQIDGPTQLEQDLLAVASETGLPTTVSDGIEALFDGRWVGLVGEFDPAALGLLGSPEPTPSPTATTALPSLSDGLPLFVQAFLDVREEVSDDGRRRYDVDLRLRDLLRSLAQVGGDLEVGTIDLEALEDELAALPETVAGRIDTADGLVTALRFDVAEAARAMGREVPGQILLRIDVSDVGRVVAPERPADAVSVPSDDLAGGLEQLLTTGR